MSQWAQEWLRSLVKREDMKNEYERKINDLVKLVNNLTEHIQEQQRSLVHAGRFFDISDEDVAAEVVSEPASSSEEVGPQARS